MTSGGLTATDVGKKSSIGGLAAEFYQRIGALVDFTPSSAETLYLDMLGEAGVQVFFNRCLVDVNVRHAVIEDVRFESDTGLDVVSAAVYIDGTYEGDLMAAAGVSYTVGREPSCTYGETLGGQWQSVSWKGVYQFCDLPISPYMSASNPSSGLLPGVDSAPAGQPGEGDYRVQAYNFRMILSDEDDKIPFPRPNGYDPAMFALLGRFLNYDARIQWRLNYTTAPFSDGPVQMRNGDSNNAGSFSSDYVGGSHYWPDGTFDPKSLSQAAQPKQGLPISLKNLYILRERIFQEHVTYQQGLMYFLANDSCVPATLQDRINVFGLDCRAFPESQHWPHQLYIREGRRMVSNYVMTQANCESRIVANDSIGLASYPMDSHFCQRVPVEVDGALTVRNEGGFGHDCPRPYPISYRSIVPKREECRNLYVPGCLSASHVAYGSIRMEPVFMILGQSAGAAASKSLDLNLAVQDLPYELLREAFIKAKQKL
jgi:hypothetical protein